jgi:hypothetical protein
MLLPIVLVLASAASAPAADTATAKLPSASNHNQVLNDGNNEHGFVIKPRRNQPGPDEGIIIPHRDCRSDQECNTRCLSITAYVFSDGENPQLQYVTDCPNLDVPYQTKRAHRNGTDTERQPRLKHTDLRSTPPAGNKDLASQ